jgi:hypothetical protein
MKILWKYALITVIVNILIAVISVAGSLEWDNQTGESFVIFFIVWVASLLLQMILALIFLAYPKRKETGKGMLLGLAILFLVGYGICISSF